MTIMATTTAIRKRKPNHKPLACRLPMQEPAAMTSIAAGEVPSAPSRDCGWITDKPKVLRKLELDCTRATRLASRQLPRSPLVGS